MYLTIELVKKADWQRCLTKHIRQCQYIYMDSSTREPNSPNESGGVPLVPAENTSAIPGTESVNPLSDLENAVNAAKATDALGGAPLTPQDQFTAQFGDRPTVAETPVSTDPILTDVKPPVTEIPAPVAPLDSSINTNPTDETAAQPEKTPKEELMEKISKIINEYSVNKAKEKVTV